MNKTKLQDEMYLRNLSINELADKIKMPPSTLGYKIRSGRFYVSEAIAIATALDWDREKFAEVFLS